MLSAVTAAEIEHAAEKIPLIWAKVVRLTIQPRTCDGDNAAEHLPPHYQRCMAKMALAGWRFTYVPGMTTQLPKSSPGMFSKNYWKVSDRNGEFVSINETLKLAVHHAWIAFN